MERSKCCIDVLDARRRRKRDVSAARDALASREAIANSRESPKRENSSQLNRFSYEDWLKVDEHTFVRQAFLELLGRLPEDNAAVGYGARLVSGERRSAILAEIRFSDEGFSRPLNDPALLKLLATEALSCIIRRPSLFLNNTDRFLSEFRGEIRGLFNEGNKNILDINSIITSFVNKNNYINSVKADISSNRDFILGSFKSRNFIKGYTLFVDNNTNVNYEILRLTVDSRHERIADIICGDHIEQLPDGSWQMFVNGPHDRLSFQPNTKLGACVLVKNELISSLDIKQSANAASIGGSRLLAEASSIDYFPVVFSEKKYDTNCDAVQTEEACKTEIAASCGLSKSNDSSLNAKNLCVIMYLMNMNEFMNFIEDLKKDKLSDFSCDIVIALDTNKDMDDFIGDALNNKRISVNYNSSNETTIRHINMTIANMYKYYNYVVIAKSNVCCSSIDNSIRDLIHNNSYNFGIISPLFKLSDGSVIDPSLAIKRDGTLIRVDQLRMNGHDIKYPRLSLNHQVSAVLPQLYVVRSCVFDSVGGLDETLELDSSMIDFCFKVQSIGMIVAVDAALTFSVKENYDFVLSSSDNISLRSRYPGWIGRADRFWTERDDDMIPYELSHSTAFNVRLGSDSKSSHWPAAGFSDTELS